MTIDFDKLLTDTLGDPRDVEAPPGSINAELLALPVQRKYAGHEVRGKVFLFPRTGIIGVPYREQGDHWGVIVTDGTGGPRKENGQEVYQHGGYDISVSALEMQTAIELKVVEAGPRALPTFVDEHQMVRFLRTKTRQERSEARGALTDAERDVQDQLDDMNESGGEYITDDVVISDAEGADGITSWDRSLPLEEQEPMHRPILDIDFEAALVPSTTPGHFHLYLYLDKPMPLSQYHALLDALGEAGILEPGYVKASTERGYSSVRLPWVKKSATVTA